MDTLQAVDSCRPELDLDAAVQPVEAAVRCTCKYKVGTSGTVVNGGVKSCHWGGAKGGHFEVRALEREALR
jgi:hypothetical protein